MKNQDSIPSVEKTIRILNAIASTASNYSIAELAKSLGIPQTTVFRIIRTLMAADWLKPRVSGVGYCLSYGIAPLLEPFMNHKMLIDAVRMPLMSLSEQTRLGLKLSVRDGSDALTIFRLESPDSMGITARVGVKFPLVFGSSGAALMLDYSKEEAENIIHKASAECWRYQKPADVLKRIQECKKTGICQDSGQYLPHIHTMSAPIRGPKNEVLAAITLLGMAHDYEPPRCASFKKHLLATVRECQELLHHGQ